MPKARPTVVKLTNLYNARQAWLEDAHSVLDRAVWSAYGWVATGPTTTTDEENLARLLGLNQDRSASQASGEVNAV